MTITGDVWVPLPATAPVEVLNTLGRLSPTIQDRFINHWDRTLVMPLLCENSIDGQNPETGLPKSDPGHWWASFFFGKSSHPFMTTVLESPENSGTFQVANGMITCDLAQEAMRKRHISEPSKPTAGPSV
ncbi:pancreatic progenitor cell differentiation and proliferation factor isoform X1 [Ornithorhynchus anatinus]|uniref:pancreatic progenitor cell differentiation and proliferation factor isoform X1 n=1 Tax=Ornithorhynchus anatinus TaxID=9258 RepID=UPI0019D4EB0E|nr:pancreatic progenitor cell differentiation and proliferation factor isoform X1 [Ornithorhynchus anatinus]